MKHDAIVGQGIPILERVELPDSWIPADSRVEIDAKITAGKFITEVADGNHTDMVKGYFTNGHRMTTEELEAVQGRGWEE
jgi:hypothetical protein